MIATWIAIADLSTRVLHWIGWQVLLSTLVFAVVLLLSRGLRGRTPSLGFTLWSLVFVRLILPPGLAHPLAIGTLISRCVSATSFGAELYAVPALADGSSPAPHPRTAGPDAQDGVRGWTPVVVSGWLIVAVILLRRGARQRRSYTRLVRAAAPVIKPAVAEAAKAWRQRLGVRRQVRLVTSSARVTPFTVGLVRPTVFLPAAVLELSDTAVESTVAHEIAHISRWDCVWLWGQQVLQAVYFFHPLVWMSGAALDQERERACDRLVLGHRVVSAPLYAKAMVDILYLRLSPIQAPALSLRTRKLTTRIRAILDTDGRSQPRPLSGLLATALLGAFLLPISWAPASTASAPPPEANAAGSDRATEAVHSMPLLDHPLPSARLSRGYTQGLDPFTGEKVFHRGLDLAAPSGTAIHAPADGVVEVATTHSADCKACGTVVVIDHLGGLSTFYSHLGPLHVVPGEEVHRGDLIAEVGSTGRSTGPHLHLEVRVDGVPVDPGRFLEERD